MQASTMFQGSSSPSQYSKPKPGGGYHYHHPGRSQGTKKHNKYHTIVTLPAEFYYCSIHQLHHCITRTAARIGPNNNDTNAHASTATEPAHGECAWLFFSPSGATQHRAHDYSDPPPVPPPSSASVRRGQRNNDNRSSSDGSCSPASSENSTLVNSVSGSGCSSPSYSPSAYFAFSSPPTPPHSPSRSRSRSRCQKKKEDAAAAAARAIMDGDGDVLMTNADTDARDDPTVVRIPIRRRLSLQDISSHSFFASNHYGNGNGNGNGGVRVGGGGGDPDSTRHVS